MSIRIMSAVWALPLADSEKLVLLALADCANDDGVCWPSIAALVRKCSKSDRTIQAAIKSLAAAGHLSRLERPGKGVLYTIHPTPEDASPPKRLPPEAPAPTPEAASDKPSRTTIPSPDAAHPPRGTRAGAATHLPDGWRPTTFGQGTEAAKIVARRGQDWARRTFESFENHWRSANGPGAKKRDWQAAWAKWVLTEDTRDGSSNRPRSTSPDLRGSRPSPGLALREAARAAEAAGAAGGSGGDRGSRLALSSEWDR